MKKTNFTFVLPLGWVFVSFALLFFNSKVSAQCVLACNDNVQVSATPDNFLNNGGIPDPCTINLNLDMILEGTNTVFGPGSGCNAAYGRIEVRRGNTLIHSSGNLTTEDQTTSFDGTLYLGQSLTTKVLIYNQAGSVLNSCWGSITLEDKARPEIDCNVSVPVNSVSGVLGTGDGRFQRTVTFTPGTNPALCQLSAVGTNTLYEAIDFTITTPGIYTFDMVATSFDAFAAIYLGGFNPANACQNLLAADDDGGTSFLGPKITLQLTLVPGNYTLVTTTFDNSGSGNYEWFIAGPGGNGAGVTPIIARTNVVTLNCAQDPSSVPAPVAYDNCDPNPTVNLIDQTISGDDCDVLVIRRTYRATDRYGNDSDPCTIEIRIVQPQLKFPDDITWTCEQYAAYPNIVDPSALHPFLIDNAAIMDRVSLLCCIPGETGDDVNLVDPYDMAIPYWADGEDLDVTLDPTYDDNIDNPITDGRPNVLDDPGTPAVVDPIFTTIGTATGESDSRPDIFNWSWLVGCPYNDTLIDFSQHIPDTFIIPSYRTYNPITRLPVLGLEDADVLEQSGSGVPNVEGTACNFAITYRDQRLEACGFDPDNGPVFKILRTWTVLNWCTGQVSTDIQVIKVIDKKKPKITFAADYDNQLESDRSTGGAHPECASSGLIEVPSVTDNCTGIADLRVFTPVGQGIPVVVGGNLIGFNIPAPYLPMGSHTIRFEATDGCGNLTVATTRITVIDGIPPTAVCRQVTRVALGSDINGYTEVLAKYFDEGSYDNCGPVYFKVVKMNENVCDNFIPSQEWFDDKVSFCCSDIRFDANGNQIPVMVVLRVYDTDPGVGRIPTARIPNNPTNLTHTGAASSLNNNRYNDCMIEVYLEDKLRPICRAPHDIWATCDTIPANTDLSDTTTLQRLFGNATSTDNCSSWTRELAPDVDVDICGVGTVTRRWVATDVARNTSLGLCRQIIQIMPRNRYRINVPNDFEGECQDVVAAGLTAEGQACDLLAISHTDDTLVAALPFCYKVVRTWKIINWCEYNGFDNPTILPRVNTDPDLLFDGYTVWSNGDYLYVGASINDPTNRIVNVSSHRGPFLAKNPANTGGVSNGYYSYEQHIKVYDNRAPVLTDTLSGPFCGGERDEDPCTGLVNLLPQIVEDCGQVDLTRVTWQLDAFSSTFVTADFSGTNRLNARYPLGTHTVRFRVPDDCGNTSQIDITFDVIDCKAPTPVCINGLSVALMPTGMVEIWAVDFDASSFDYCHPIKFRVNRIVDLNGNGIVDANELRTTPPTTDSIVLRCKDRPRINVQLWVGEESTDNVNQWDYCVTFVEVQDPNGACSGSRPSSIAGTIKNGSGAGVSNVNVALSGNMTTNVVTGVDGSYLFNSLVRGNDYTVTPHRDDDVRNGVTTFDLTLISKHILNVQPLDSPYKIIAADANNSRSVTTLDLVLLRKVILHVEDQLPNNTSWRFVDKNFVFNDPAKPFATIFNEVKSFNDIIGDQIADFVAIKVGDVNGSAKPNQLGASIDDRSFNGTLNFLVDDQQIVAGEEVKVAFKSTDLASALGYQFTLNFDTKALELVNVIGGVAKEENFGLTHLDEGVVTTSWNGEATSEDVFTLVFKAKATGHLSQFFSVDSKYTVAEAYGKDASLMNVAVKFNSGVVATSEFGLYQNTPNPFKGATVIGFNLPEASFGTLTISDVSGKVLKVIKGDFNKGYNQVSVNSGEFSQAGVMYYQLETATHTATKKMIIIE